MFTELLQAEIWRKRLESAGYRVILEAWDSPPLRRARATDRDNIRDRPTRPPQTPAATP